MLKHSFHLLKSLIISFFVLIALLVAGVFYVSKQLPTWIHDKAQEIGEKAGYVIDFKDFQYTILEPNIQFSNFKIQQKSNQANLISVGQLNLRYDFWPLLRQKIQVNSLTMQDLAVDITKDPKLNFLHFIDAIEKIYPPDPQTTHQPSTWTYRLKSVDITNGLLRINDQPKQFKSDFSFKSLHLDNAVNFDNQGKIIGHLQSNFQIELNPLELQLPRKKKLLETDALHLSGDFLIAKNEDIQVHIESSGDRGRLLSDITIKQNYEVIEADVALKHVSLVPVLHMEAPKSPRALKSGVVTGKLHYLMDQKDERVSAELALEDVNIPPLLDLLPANIKLIGKSGKAFAQLKIEDSLENLQLSGAVQVKNLAIFEVDKSNELLAWNLGTIKHFEYNQSPKESRLKMEEVVVDGLKARVTIYADKSNNFMRMFPPSAKEMQKNELARQIATLEEAIQKNGAVNAPTLTEKLNQLVARQTSLRKGVGVEKNSNPFQANIKSVTVKNGSMSFTDFSVRPIFKTEIRNLRGTLIGISTKPKRYATAALEGLVGPQGDVKIDGQIAFEDPRRNNKVHLSFRRIPLAAINPYYTNLAGYDVVDGTLSYDSTYTTKDGELTGDNRFIINNIVMGDRNPAYKGTFIPMKLITSLLEDKDGVIDLNLSVRGNVDNPEFQISKLLWDAFFTIVGNVVKTPFIAIGRLFGIENLKGIYFSPGSDHLRPSESLKLEKIAIGLDKKPKLKLQVNGVYDEKVDALELATNEVDRQIFKRGGFSVLANEPLPKMPLSDDRIQRAINRIFEEQNIPLPAKPTLNGTPASNTAATEKYYQQLHDVLITRVNVSEQELIHLAQERARKVKEEVLKYYPSLRDRVILEPIKVESAEADGVAIGVAFIN